MEVLVKIKKNEKNVMHSIWILRILLLCMNDKENEKKLKYVENIESELTNALEEYEDWLTKNQDSNVENETYNQIINDLETIMNIVSEMKEDLFPKFKLASIIVIDNMSNESLKVFYERLNKFLTEYNNIQEACDFLFYHTGEELSDFITSLISYVKNFATDRVKRLIPLEYFESKTTIITLTYKDWVEIFNNIRFTIKYVGNVEKKSYAKLMEKYHKLEVYYFIIITVNLMDSNEGS